MQYWVNNRNKILIGLFAVISVLLLFFLPELLDWQYSFYEKDSYPALEQVVVQDVAQTDLQHDYDAVVDESTLRPLDKISYLIDSGYIESERSKRNSRILRDKYEQGLIEPSWAQLKSSEALSELARLREQAMVVLRSLEEDHEFLRRILLDFVGIVSFITSDADQVLSARDALDELRMNYLDVTRALAEANVGRNIFLQWSNVELGPLFDKVISDAALYKMKPFEPQIRIVEVQLYQGADGYGNRNPQMRPAIRLRGQVRGNDLKSFVLERDGELIQKFRLKPVENSSDLWSFEYADRDARGFLKFKAEDINGNISFKTYQFTSQIEAFPWQDGEFKINFPKGDPRLDRIFLVSRPRAPQVSSFFDRRGIVRF